VIQTLNPQVEYHDKQEVVPFPLVKQEVVVGVVVGVIAEYHDVVQVLDDHMAGIQEVSACQDLQAEKDQKKGEQGHPDELVAGLLVDRVEDVNVRWPDVVLDYVRGCTVLGQVKRALGGSQVDECGGDVGSPDFCLSLLLIHVALMVLSLGVPALIVGPVSVAVWALLAFLVVVLHVLFAVDVHEGQSVFLIFSYDSDHVDSVALV